MTGSAQDLAAAVKALVPGLVVIADSAVEVEVYDSAVTEEKPPRMYFVVNVRLPAPAERTESAQAVSVLAKVTVTVGARTPVGVRDMSTAAADALDRIRPAAAGWTTGPLLLRNTRGPEKDPSLTFSDSTRVVYGLLEFDLTASRLPL